MTFVQLMTEAQFDRFVEDELTKANKILAKAGQPLFEVIGKEQIWYAVGKNGPSLVLELDSNLKIHPGLKVTLEGPELFKDSRGQDFLYLGLVDEREGMKTIFTNRDLSIQDQIPLRDMETGVVKCSFCHKATHRVKHFFFKNKVTGAIEVLGSNCVKSFFGDERILRLLDLIEILGHIPGDDEDQDPLGGGGSFHFGWDTIDLHASLKYVTANFTKAFIGQNKALAEEIQSTTSEVRSALSSKEARRLIEDTRPSWIEWEEIEKKILEKIQNTPVKSDFDFNVRETLMFKGTDKDGNPKETLRRWIPLKAAGIAIFGLYKFCAEEKVIEAAKSEHLGQMGDRITLGKLTIKRWTNLGHFHYGAPDSYKFEMEDENGNILEYVTSSYDFKLRIEEEGEKAIPAGYTATVKFLKAFRGAKVTVVTRVTAPKEKKAKTKKTKVLEVENV